MVPAVDPAQVKTFLSEIEHLLKPESRIWAPMIVGASSGKVSDSEEEYSEASQDSDEEKYLDSRASMTSSSSKSVYSDAEEYSVTCRSDSELEYSDAQESNQEYSECDEDSEDDSLTTFNITEDSDEEHKEEDNKEEQKIDQCEKEETSQRWKMLKARGVVDSSLLQGKTDH